jgi:hypothetical protein
MTCDGAKASVWSNEATKGPRGLYSPAMAASFRCRPRDRCNNTCCFAGGSIVADARLGPPAFTLPNPTSAAAFPAPVAAPYVRGK